MTLKSKDQIIKLNDVWYVPKIKKNLFSVLSAHERKKNSVFTSKINKCSFKVDNRLWLTGSRKEGSGLFQLQVETILPTINQMLLKVQVQSSSCITKD